MHRIRGNAPYFGHFRGIFDLRKSLMNNDL